MSSRWLILKRFLSHPTQVGAVVPSSPSLCRMMTCELGLEHASAVAELGPGTGVITREIVDNIGEKTTFFAVELDQIIYQEFRSALPEITIFNANACDLDKLCNQAGVDDLDVVISGLPWASFPAALQSDILEAICKSLKPGGRFATFAYLQGMPLPGARHFRNLLNKQFAKVELSPVVWRNFPPAIVYRCTK